MGNFKVKHGGGSNNLWHCLIAYALLFIGTHDKMKLIQKGTTTDFWQKWTFLDQEKNPQNHWSVVYDAF